MNETIRNIKERRCLRAYKDKKISKEILQELIDCARLAPSGRNEQPWEFVVVTEREMLGKIAEIATYGSFIKDAAACVVVCGIAGAKHLIEDGSAATQNIMLAAHSLGIASCWVAGWKRTYNPELQKLLGMPSNIEPVSIIPLGYADEKVKPKGKRELEQVLHWGKF